MMVKKNFWMFLIVSYIYLFKRKRAPLNNFYRAALASLALELIGRGTLIWFFSIADERLNFLLIRFFITQSNGNNITFPASY